MLCQQAHYRDGGTSFPQSTFQVAFFIPHPTGVSELPDKILDCLTFRSEFIMLNALMIETTSSIAFTHECTRHAFLRQLEAGLFLCEDYCCLVSTS
jgi:hypothetical protein